MNKLLQVLGLALTLTTPMAAPAAPVTLAFSGSGFENAGVPFPGFDGPIQGSITWESSNLLDPIGALLAIDLTIAGHTYSLAEVGLGPQGTTQSGIGGLVNGANSAIGNGQDHDFLLVVDRVQPAVTTFAFVIQGKQGAIWWTPRVTEAHFVTDVQQVPEPATAALVLGALAALGGRRRGRSDQTASSPWRSSPSLP